MIRTEEGWWECRRYFSGASAPPPTQLGKTAKEEDKAVQEAAAEAIRRKQRQKGYRATILAKDLITDDTMKNLKQTLGS